MLVLGVVGGNDDTRDDVEAHARNAVLFALADDRRNSDVLRNEVGYIGRTLSHWPPAANTVIRAVSSHTRQPHERPSPFFWRQNLAVRPDNAYRFHHHGISLDIAGN